jgi:hypothetical protein
MHRTVQSAPQSPLLQRSGAGQSAFVRHSSQSPSTQYGSTLQSASVRHSMHRARVRSQYRSSRSRSQSAFVLQQFIVAGSQSGSGGALASQSLASQVALVALVALGGMLASQPEPLQLGAAQPPAGQASLFAEASLTVRGGGAQLAAGQPGSQRSGLQTGDRCGAQSGPLQMTGARQSAVSHCRPMTPGLWHAASSQPKRSARPMLRQISRE